MLAAPRSSGRTGDGRAEDDVLLLAFCPSQRRVCILAGAASPAVLLQPARGFIDFWAAL